MIVGPPRTPTGGKGLPGTELIRLGKCDLIHEKIRPKVSHFFLIFTAFSLENIPEVERAI